MRFVSGGVKQRLSVGHGRDLDDPCAVGVGVQRLGRVGERFVDLADRAADGADHVGDRLDRLDIAEALTGGDAVALGGQVDKDHIAQRILGKIRNADHGDVAVHLDPLVGLGILQLSRDVHGNFLLKIVLNECCL